jgi:hypothetical protein
MLPAMSPFVRLGVALALGCAGAVLWAYGLVVLEPLTEPMPADALSDSYWARDLRWSAVLAVAATLLWLSRGRRPYAWFAPLAAVVWLAADIGLDRLDITRDALVPVAVTGCAAVIGAGVLLVRSQGESNRRPMIAAAAVCAVNAPLCLPEEADGAPGARIWTTALLLVVALVCALSASPAPFRMRITAGVAAALWFSAAAAGLFTGAFLLAAAAVLLAGVWLITRAWPGWWRATAGAAATIVGFPLLGYALFIASEQWGRPLTALAGNPHIVGADADVVLPLTGALVGLVFAVLWSIPWRRTLTRSHGRTPPPLTTVES